MATESGFNYDIAALLAAYRVFVQRRKIVSLQYAIELSNLNDVMDKLKKLRGDNGS